MSMDASLALLRWFVYVGSVAAAGGVLFALSFRSAAEAVGPALRRQIVFGCCLLLLIEPLRYVAFQFAAADGDWTRAFAPDLRWMAFETSMGRAAAARWVAAAALLAGGWRWSRVRLAAALVMIGSFLFEGHTAGLERPSAYATVALALHVTAVHWWLGALYPLVALTRLPPPASASDTVGAFSGLAVPIVLALAAAGAVLFGVLIEWRLDPGSPYQQRFLFKLALVTAMLAIAARNKFRLTPLLKRDAATGSAKLRASIMTETWVALAILAATAWAIGVAPDH